MSHTPVPRALARFGGAASTWRGWWSSALPSVRMAVAFILAATWVPVMALSRPPAPEQEGDAGQLLQRMADAAQRAGQAWRGVVAHEIYVQSMRPWPGVPPSAPGRGRALAVRTLQADLLLVYDASGPWDLHRDVIEVNGKVVSDRTARLEALFLTPGRYARERLRDVTRESARFNLGDIPRTFNVPTFPLVVVHPTHRQRFALRPERVSASAPGIRHLQFTERTRPTLIRSTLGRDVPLRGRLLVDEASGELVEATIEPEASGVASRIRVRYEHVDGMAIRVPVTMWEWYHVAGPLTDPQVNGGRGLHNAYVDAVATYSDFRRYGVATTETHVP